MAAGAIAWQRGNLATARRLIAEAIGCYRGKGYMDALLGDTAAPRAQLQESIALCRELDEMDIRSRALAILSGVAQQEGNLAEATARYDESLDLLRKMGLEEDCAETVFHLARLVEAQGHGRLATKLCNDCLGLFPGQGNEAGVQRCRARLPARPLD
jgi:hypothetical protein